jgi:hypothetical protein
MCIVTYNNICVVILFTFPLISFSARHNIIIIMILVFIRQCSSKTGLIPVRFKVLTVAVMKMAVF